MNRKCDLKKRQRKKRQPSPENLSVNNAIGLGLQRNNFTSDISTSLFDSSQKTVGKLHC